MGIMNIITIIMGTRNTTTTSTITVTMSITIMVTKNTTIITRKAA